MNFSQGLRFVSVSMDIEDFHFSFQTEWMASMLIHQENRTVEGSPSREPYSGGLLSDVTYRFFQKGYLLTTSMYNDKLERWVPILLMWLGGLYTKHYKAHFTTILKQIKHCSLPDKDKRKLSEQVVDFSQAQKSGFIDAYMEVFNTDRKSALSKLHGCEQHFSQAITVLKKIGTLYGRIWM